MTNTVSSCGLDALADAIEQAAIERAQPPDWPRTARMGTAGLLMGPLDHYWYRFLDFRHPGTHAAAIARKVSLDIFLYGPVAVVLFYLGESRLRMRIIFTAYAARCSDVQAGGEELERGVG